VVLASFCEYAVATTPLALPATAGVTDSPAGSDAVDASAGANRTSACALAVASATTARDITVSLPPVMISVA